MTRTISTFCLLFALGACSKEPAREGPAPSTGASRAAPFVSAAPLPVSAAPVASATSPRTEVARFLDRWVAAQNDGDADGYLAMYDVAVFQGVKRLAAGGKKDFDFAGWKADREAMVRGKPRVAAERVEIKTWLEGSLPENTATVTFVQRWKAGTYADHGKKTLTAR